MTQFYDPETLNMLRSTLDEAWAELPSHQKTTPKSEMAVRILALAEKGERNRTRLKAAALLRLVN